MKKENIISLNGKIIPLSKSAILPTNLEFSYGFGVYETIKLRNGVLYFLDKHIDRLIKSAKIIELSHNFEKKELMDYVIDLVKAQGEQSINIKILMIGASDAEKVNFYIMALPPLFPDKKLYKKGAKLICRNYERLYPNAKSLNMMASYLAYREAKENDCYDGLLINRYGEATEGTRTNFYLTKGKTIYSPPDTDILLGVTRDTVLKTAVKNGYKVIKQKIKLADLEKYDGAFVTSTSTKIIPIKEIILSKDKKFEYKEISLEIKNLIKIYDSFLKDYALTQDKLV